MRYDDEQTGDNLGSAELRFQRNKPTRGVEQTAGVDQTPAPAFPDLEGFDDEAARLVEHPAFDAAMLAFCRGLADFHATGLSGRGGVVDTVTFAVAMLTLYFDRYGPERANANYFAALCADGKLAGATAVRNAIARHLHAGMILAEEPRVAGLPRRLRPTPKLFAAMRHNLAVRLAAIEPVIAWPKPAAEWAETDGALDGFVRGNVEAYRRARYTLFQKFPEVRGFMDRHCGYHILLDALARMEARDKGAFGVLRLREVAARFAVSRAHVRKLFAAANARGDMALEAGGALFVPSATWARFRLWFGYEFAWARRLVGTAEADVSPRADAPSPAAAPSSPSTNR